MPKSFAPYEDRSRVGRWRMLRQLGELGHDPGRQQVGRRLAEARAPVVAGAQDDQPVGPAQEFQLYHHGEEQVEAEAGRRVEGDRDPDDPDVDNEQEDEAENEQEREEEESENEDDVDEELEPFNPNAPLYLNAPVTVNDVMVGMMSLMLEYNLTKSCVSAILELHNLSCPRENLKTLSWYKLQKHYRCPKAPLHKHYYCSECQRSLGGPGEVCPVCGEDKKPSYFVRMPILPQLRQMFKRDSFYQDIQHRFYRDRIADNEVADIYDGSVYKEHIRNGFLTNPNNISFSWYTDKVTVFQSRNYSINPFMLQINELPYHKRTKRENVLLVGLWFGAGKPAVNMFLRSFVPCFQKIYNGVHIQVPLFNKPILLRGIVIAGVCDVPAKSSFLNVLGHTGYHGCAHCEIRGVRVQGTNKEKIVFLFQENLTNRTVESFMGYARRAIYLEDDVLGVKGPTALRLFMPDFLQGMGIDPMHLVTGVTKKLLKLHFDSKFSRFHFSRRALLPLADEVLKKIRPHKFIHRKPSSLEHITRWKASELMAWLCGYAIAVYDGVLSPAHYNHFLKFVAGICFLNAETVTHRMIDMAEQLLRDFVHEYENLYGQRFCTINIHLLLHLPDCVRRLGPTRTMSCFSWENLNGVLLRTVHGKTNVDSQLCASFWKSMFLARQVDAVENAAIKNFILRQKRSLHIGERIARSCYVVGWETETIPLHDIVQNALEEENVPLRPMKAYFRLLKNGLIYTSMQYNRDKLGDSTYVEYKENDLVKMGRTICFVKVSQCDCDVECPCVKEHYAIVQLLRKVGDVNIAGYRNCRLNHIHKYAEARPVGVKAIPVTMLQTVCCGMTAYGTLFIAKPANSVEVMM